MFLNNNLVANATVTTNTTNATSLNSINITASISDSQIYTGTTLTRWIDVVDTIKPQIKEKILKEEIRII